MKLKIKEKDNGYRYHVWDSEQSTSAMVIFSSMWATSIVLAFTGQIAPGLCVATIAFTLLVVLPLLIAVMNRIARKIPIPPDYAAIAAMEQEIYPPCPKCHQTILDDLEALTHECPSGMVS